MHARAYACTCIRVFVYVFSGARLKYNCRGGTLRDTLSLTAKSRNSSCPSCQLSLSLSLSLSLPSFFSFCLSFRVGITAFIAFRITDYKILDVWRTLPRGSLYMRRYVRRETSRTVRRLSGYLSRFSRLSALGATSSNVKRVTAFEKV